MNQSAYTFWAVAVILLSTAANALHDRWITRNVGWWQWHIVKWIMFFPPLVYIAVYFLSWQWWLPLAIVSWILWRIIYKGKLIFW